jgi:hypothetical protein
MACVWPFLSLVPHLAGGKGAWGLSHLKDKVSQGTCPGPPVRTQLFKVTCLGFVEWMFEMD